MSKQDYYATLGVEKGADGAALKSAYRKLAMKYHPDKNPGDASAEQKFKDINEAYDVLKDPQKKAAYDRFGHQAFQSGGFGQGRGHPGAESLAIIAVPAKLKLVWFELSSRHGPGLERLRNPYTGRAVLDTANKERQIVAGGSLC